MLRPVFCSIMLLSFILFLAACEDDPKKYQPPQLQSFNLPVTTVHIEDIPRYYRVPGSIKSDERIEISSRISGYIQKITAQEGDKVSKGDILVEIDPTDIEGRISQAQAVLKSAKTALKDSELDVSKLSKLQKKQAVSNERYRKSTVKRDVARSSLAEAQAALDTALSARRYVSVKSPINGVVVARHKRTGDLAIPGMPVLTIESSTILLFKTSVAESRIKDIHVADEVRVEIDALDHAIIDGAVLRVIPSGDSVTRRYDVEITLPSESESFPGMFGRAHFIIGSDKRPVVLKKSITERGGLKGVFIIDADKKARFRWLRTGREWSDRVEVRVGLEGGERILLNDDRRVHDGDIITSVLLPLDSKKPAPTDQSNGASEK